MTAAPVERQGRVVVEPDPDGGLLIMLPTGDVRRVRDSAAAERVARVYFKRTVGAGSVGVGTIEWRGGTAPSAAGGGAESPRVGVGDAVQVWFDTGAFGASILYGRVIASGPVAFSVRWESGIVNRVRHADARGLGVVPAQDAALAESILVKAEARS